MRNGRSFPDQNRLRAEPDDGGDFDVSAGALEPRQCARLVRTTRAALGLTQTEFAARFRAPVGRLRDWEQARATPPDFALAYVTVIARFPELVTEARG